MSPGRLPIAAAIGVGLILITVALGVLYADFVRRERLWVELSTLSAPVSLEFSQTLPAGGAPTGDGQRELGAEAVRELAAIKAAEREERRRISGELGEPAGLVPGVACAAAGLGSLGLGVTLALLGRGRAPGA